MSALCVAAASSVSAKTLTTPSSLTRAAQPEKVTPARMAQSKGMMANGAAWLGDPKTINAAKKALKAPSRADEGEDTEETTEIPEVISERPEGQSQLYSRAGNSMQVFWGYLFESTQNGIALDIVTAPDGQTLYFEDIVSGCSFDTYVKATKEGNTISIPVGQCVIFDEDYGYGLNLYAGKYYTYEEDGETYGSYAIDPETTEIKFTVAEDGSMKIEDKFCSAEGYNSEYVVTYFYTDDDSWSGYTDWNSQYTPFNDEPTALPDGIELKDYVFHSEDYAYQETNDYLLPCGVSGDKFYITYLSESNPDNVVVGTIEGDKVRFAQNQYLGQESGYFAYFVGANFTAQLVEDPDYGDYITTTYSLPEGDFVMNYDAEAHRLTAAENTAIIINTGAATTDADISSLASYDNPVFYEFKEIEATPADPSITYFYDGFEDYGYLYLTADIPCTDAEGTYLSPALMSYSFYYRIDDEESIFEFTADDYYGFAELGIESMTEVPYSFSCYDKDGYADISKGGSMVLFYTSAPDAIGVKSIYTGLGIRHESPISWYQISESSIKEIGVSEGNGAIYDLMGRRLSAPFRGINIINGKKVLVK